MTTESATARVGLYPTLPSVKPTTRDPYGVNKHLQLDFTRVIGEPERSAYSFIFVHHAANRVYRYSKLFLYRLLTTLVGLPLMLFWGLALGIYTFVMIWIAAPMRRMGRSLISEFGVYIQTVSDAIIAPLFRSYGQMRSNMRVTIQSAQIDASKQMAVQTNHV